MSNSEKQKRENNRLLFVNRLKFLTEKPGTCTNQRVIICTTCRTENPDDAHLCEKCGKKLQSRRKFLCVPTQETRTRLQPMNEPDGNLMPKGMLRLFGPWLVIIACAVAAGLCIAHETWLPMLPVLALGSLSGYLLLKD